MDFSERVENLFEQYRKQQDGLGALTRRMNEIRATATSPRREVEVTVGHHGAVTNLRFPSGAYKRMTPKELAEVVLATIASAQSLAHDQAAEILSPLLPAGVNARDLVSGKLAPAVLAPEQPNLTNHLREQLGLGRVPQ
jgi:YbaB/EbfC DNA-binding family